MRVFLDTNVLVSAIATRGICADVLRLVLSEHDLLSGEVVIEEVRRVLSRKFRMPEAVVEEALTFLYEQHVEPRPAVLPDIPVRDPDDLWVLASALVAGADVLVTGDQDLLTIRDQVKELIITDPRGFWSLHKER